MGRPERPRARGPDVQTCGTHQTRCTGVGGTRRHRNGKVSLTLDLNNLLRGYKSDTLVSNRPVELLKKMDVPACASVLSYFAGSAYHVLGESSLSSANFLNVSVRQPYGVVGLIIPWNVPMIMFAFKVAPALITGNTVVLKSSEKAPLSSLKLASLIKEAGFPPGVVNVLSGFGMPTGSAMAMHMKIRKLSFTGSISTGKKIMKMAADSNLKNVSLELGGKSPAIIFEDADVALAAR